MANPNRQIGKQIQQLMESPAWAGIEAFLASFIARNFIQTSIKRGTDFDTIWYAAEAEGGKRFIQQFFRELEEEAQKADQ